MYHPRRAARIAGLLYLLTVATSIPALALKEPVLTDPARLASAAGAAALGWAVVLEVILLFACVGTAVVLYPLLRRRHDIAALGFVSARIVEGACIAIGVVAMMSLVAVARGADPGQSLDVALDPALDPSLDPALTVLVAVHDAAFLLGPGLIPAVNALLLGSILFRARLVPRILPVVGFIGAPLLLASVGATLFGAVDQVSPIAGLAALPIALWEISLGVWLVVKGVRIDARDPLRESAIPIV